VRSVTVRVQQKVAGLETSRTEAILLQAGAESNAEN
jgi:hypothetical protein